MIKRIIAFMLPLFLIIAIVLKINGVDHIELTTQYYRFLQRVMIGTQEFKIYIPNIPTIPEFNESNAAFLNAIIFFINQLIKLINSIVAILNMLIDVLVFIFVFISQFIGAIGDFFIHPQEDFSMSNGITLFIGNI